MRLMIKDVAFSYGSAAILKGITAEIRDGEVVSVVGPNGSGKTTLLKCAARILKPRGGVVCLDGKDVAAMSGRELARKQGYVPQAAAQAFPLTVMETVLLGRKPHIQWGVGRRDLDVVEEVMGELGLLEMADRLFGELSGGQKQKVVIARALAQEAEVMLLDEPTSALDIRHQLEVLEVVKGLARRKGKVVVLVMHDLELAARYSDRLLLMKDGGIYAEGPPEAVLAPEHIRSVYGVEAEVRRGPLGPEVLAVRPV